ncbi:tetratricopeptide repeat-containing sensor histidine kinase [Membranihabitans marinus]|uniref:tetratricopeptide repeat-containing sensor histidine kinase n=1 Tax=Membranihabitans marinus TaxID=1227546 RepID=UPI001F308747|nr:tetratricopeptide repeat protein [Membranihabitans marinus]
MNLSIKPENILIYFILFFNIHIVYGQVPKDSLAAEEMWLAITKEKKDTKRKADMYYDLGFYILSIDVDSAGILFEKVKTISEKIDYKEGIVNYYAGYTNVLNYKGEIEQGLEFNLQSIDIAKQIEDSTYLGKQLANIGISYNYLGDYDSAITYLRRALTIYQSINDEEKVGRLMLTLGILYNNFSSDILLDSAILEQSLSFLLQALPIAQSLKDTVLEIEILTNLGNTYNNSKNHDQGEKHLDRAKTLAQNIESNTLLEPIYRYLSVVYRSKEQAQKAIEYANKALEISKDWGANIYRLLTQKELALAYSLNNQPEKANLILNELIPFAESENLNFILDGLYINYAENHADIGEYEKAFHYYEKGKQLSDSLRGGEIKTQLLSLEKKYESAKKDAQILSMGYQQEKQKWWILALIGLIVLISTIGLIVVQRWKFKAKIAKEEKKRLEKEKQIITSESIIQGQEDERQRIAQDLHDGLGGILSGLKFTLNTMDGNVILSESNHQVFHKALDQLDQAISEMRKVAHNMMPEALINFGLDDTVRDYINDINQHSKTQIHYSSYDYKPMAQSTEITLYRIIQEAINNSIKHAEASDIYIQLNRENQNITLSIEDNGRGFDPSLNHKGIGLKNIRNRVEYLNGRIEINSTVGRGTVIMVEIKLNTDDQ